MTTVSEVVPRISGSARILANLDSAKKLSTSIRYIMAGSELLAENQFNPNQSRHSYLKPKVPQEEIVGLKDFSLERYNELPEDINQAIQDFRRNIESDLPLIRDFLENIHLALDDISFSGDINQIIKENIFNSCSESDKKLLEDLFFVLACEAKSSSKIKKSLSSNSSDESYDPISLLLLISEEIKKLRYSYRDHFFGKNMISDSSQLF